MPLFRLNAASHVQNDANGNPVEFVKGDVFESSDPMIIGDRARHTPITDDRVKASPGRPVHSVKTTAAPSPAPVKTTTPSPTTGDDTLSSMSEAELRAFAKAEEINVSKCKTKDDLLKVIREASAE